MYGQRLPPRRKTGFGRILFVLAVLGFSGWYIYTTLVPSGIRTAVISSGSLGFKYTGDAMIVRNETAYDEDGVTSVQYKAEEGSKVYKGDLICLVYTSGYSQKEVNTLQNLRDQIKDYQRGLIAQESTFDQKMTNLESDVLLKAKDVRKMVQGAKGNMLNMEKILDAAITARQDYIRQKYRDDTRLSRLYDDESTQLKRIQSYTKQRAATQESLVSFYTDGYEELNTSNFEQFSPTQVRAMLNGAKPEKSAVERGRTTIYRLVRQNGWGVLLLLNSPDWTPVQGQSYQLKLEQFENTVVNATVMSFTRSGGELLLRLSIPTDVSPVLFMRTCQAEIGENVSSILVPTRCIYRQKDPSSGAFMTGVVVMDGINQAFVPVTVISTDGDNTYIEAVPPWSLDIGQTIRVF
jgi:hypothetical protein